MKKIASFGLPTALLIFAFLVYWHTKPPSILWIDSGTMIAASASLGIPNPPGFPSYMMASHAFGLIPFANMLTRLELFTIIFSVWFLFLIYHIILLIIQSDFFFHKSSQVTNHSSYSFLPHLAAIFGTLTLAFSYQYWSQSQNTEAFIFSYSFVALFAYLLLKTQVVKKQMSQQFVSVNKYAAHVFKILLIIAFLYGLAAGANPTVASFVPAVIYFMYLNRKFLNIQKLLVLGIVFFLTVAAVYSYLPVRASSWPFVNWGNPQTLELFIGHLRGAGLNINEPGPAGSINGFTGSPLVFAQSVSYFLLSSFFQFTPVLWPLIILGIIFLFKKNRHLLFFLLIVPIFDIVYSGIYLSGNQESWFILAWMFFAIFIGIGYFYLALAFLKNRTKIFLCFSLSLIPLVVFFIPLNRSHHYYSFDYMHNLYTPLAKDAILIGTGDFFDALSHYLHQADILRPDVTPITANVFYVNRWNRDTLRHTTNLSFSDKLESMIQYKSLTEYNEVMNQLIAENIDKHPIYVTHLTLRASALAGTNAGQLRLDSRFKFIPNGLSLRVVRADDKVAPEPASYYYTFKTPLAKKPFYFERNYNGAFGNILNDYLYGYEALGDYYLAQQKEDLALKYYEQARLTSDKNAEILARLGEFYAKRNDFNASYNYLEKAERLDVNNPTIHFNLGLSYVNLNKILEAKTEFEAVIQLLGPSDPLSKEADKLLKELSIINLNDASFVADTQNWQTAKYVRNNLKLKLPPEFTSQEFKETGLILISDKNPGVLGLNIEVLAAQIPENANIDETIQKSLIKMTGTLLDTQPLKFQGYRAFVQIYGTSGGDSSQLFIIFKNDWLWQFKVYPGNSQKGQIFYKILSTFEQLKY